MKLRIKMALIALSTGMIALQSLSCLARWFGDFVGDNLFFRNID